jgi:hypothetical protein
MADNVIKFPVKVYKYIGNTAYSDYYDLTEQELAHQCCIYGCLLFFADTIPTSEFMNIDMNSVGLEDIANYESTPWWDWPDNLKEIMYQRVPETRPKVNC